MPSEQCGRSAVPAVLLCPAPELGATKGGAAVLPGQGLPADTAVLISYCTGDSEQLGNCFSALWITPRLTEERHFSPRCFPVHFHLSCQSRIGVSPHLLIAARECWAGGLGSALTVTWFSSRKLDGMWYFFFATTSCEVDWTRGNCAIWCSLSLARISHSASCDSAHVSLEGGFCGHFCVQAGHGQSPVPT